MHLSLVLWPSQRTGFMHQFTNRWGCRKWVLSSSIGMNGWWMDDEWMMNGWWMDDEWMRMMNGWCFILGECSFNLFNIIDEARPDDTDVVDAADASPLATPRPNLSFEVINSTVRFSGPLLKRSGASVGTSWPWPWTFPKFTRNGRPKIGGSVLGLPHS